MTGEETGGITLHSLQVGQKQNLIPVRAINISVCFELKQRSIYKPSPWTRKDIYLKPCKVIWQHNLARRPVFGWGSQSFYETQQLQRYIVTYIYIYTKDMCPCMLKLLQDLCDVFFQWNLSDQQTRTNERKKSKTESMNEKCKLWKSVQVNTLNTTMEILFARCQLHIRDHIVLIFYMYNYFLWQFNNLIWYMYLSLAIFI